MLSEGKWGPGPPPDTIFFAQVSCQAEGGDDGEYMWRKRYIGLLVTTIGVFMCIYGRITFYHIYSMLTIEEKLLDHDLVSIEDYTMTARVGRDLYDYASKYNKDDPEDDPDFVPLIRFKNYFKHNLERELFKKAKQKHPNDKLEAEKYKIADISFAFNNREMLILLAKRNKYLSKADFEKVKKVEQEMTDLKN